MDILYEYIRKSLRRHRKRTTLTITSIALAAALLFSALAFMSALNNNMNENLKRSTGNYHVKFNVVEPDFEGYLNHNLLLDSLMKIQDYGLSPLKESKNEDKRYVKILGFSSEAVANFDINLTEGRLPENSNEIIVSDYLLYNGKVEMNVGQQVVLNIGYRQGVKGLPIPDLYPIEENEAFLSEYSKTFQIVGVFERSNFESYQAPYYLMITTYDEGLILPLEAYLRYKDINDTYRNSERLAKQFEGQYSTYTYNSDLLKYNNVFASQLGMNQSILLIMIFLGIFLIAIIALIYTSYANSYVNREKHLAILKSNGATGKQIQMMILYEEILISMVSLPIGFICGYAFTLFAFYQINQLLFSLDYNAIPFKMENSLALFLISFVLILVISTISMKIAAKKASRKTISSTLESNDEVEELSDNYLQTNERFNIEQKLTIKHLRQNHKSYQKITIFCILIILVFIFFQSMIGYIKQGRYYNDSAFNYDVAVSIVNDTYPTRVITATKLIDGYSELYVSEELDVTSQQLEHFNPEFIEGRYEDHVEFTLVSYSDKIIESFAEKNDLLAGYELYRLHDIEKPLGILFNSYMNEEQKASEIASGKTMIELAYASDLAVSPSVSMELIKTNQMLPGISIDDKPKIIISKTLMSKIRKSAQISEPYRVKIYYDTNNSDFVEKKLNMMPSGNLVDDFDVVNVISSINDSKTVKLLLELLFYGYVIIIALMGSIATMNIVSVNFEYRRKEFVLYRLVGLRMRSIRKMILGEILYYTLRIFVIAIPLGLSLNAIVYKLYLQELGYQFFIPQGSMLSIVIVFAVLDFILLVYTSEKIRKSRFINELKNEINQL